MPRTWATLGADVELDLGGPRLRRGLEESLREAVREGRLRPGTRLPSTRSLAQELGLARNTVADAYAQLVAEGWLAARTGSGTWVAEPSPRAAPASVRMAPAAPAGPRFDLRPGFPDLAAFPRGAWLAAARRALATAPAGAFGYAGAQGRPELRRRLSEYLARARGVVADPDRVVVTSGFAESLALLSAVMRARGARELALEAFGHPLHARVAEAAGLRCRTVDVDERGAVLEGLGSAAALLLTPAHQFPIGVALDPDRRRSAVAWAEAHRALVIEDDYDGEFRYDRQAVSALQALAPERVAYAGTASKSLAPGLRLGWLVLPRDLVEPVVELRRSTGRLTSVVDQLTLAELIAAGEYDRQVRRMRLAYRRRRDRLVSALAAAGPALRVGGIAAGLHARVELRPGQDESGVVARALEHGLALEGLGAYTQGPFRRPPALVVGYGHPPEHAFTTAVARLVAVLD